MLCFRVRVSSFASRMLQEESESDDDDMGFGLMDSDEAIPMQAQAAPGGAPPPPPPAPRPTAAMAAPAAPAMKLSKMSFASSFLDVQARSRVESTLKSRFKPVELTKEMAETYYYGREDFAADDDEANLFWLDLLQWDESKHSSFLSQVRIMNPASPRSLDPASAPDTDDSCYP